MTDPSEKPKDEECWQCGAPADPRCAYRLSLVARPGRELETMGYPVTRRISQDTIRIPVPRCAACKAWNRLSYALLLLGLMAGAPAGAIARLIWPNLTDGSAAIGAVLGCALAIVAIAWRRRRSGRRSLGAYPPVVELRKVGWSYPS
ncbi:hypothetical protein [Rhodoblastus sp.]|uniref:hypothetical protein n=1 Tax=Rhodoblastus sp. TaxID=1962975 RepID=UPI003F9B31F0